ncbi:MAG: hypothetical protein KDH48_25370, partial [Rhodoferax sp.]|nr:hypothetical protein [Rhodoferax sp.]
MLVAALLVSACGGGGGDGSTPLAVPIDCGASCAQDMLSAQDVEQVVAQTVVAAQARGRSVTVAVTDRVGN